MKSIAFVALALANGIVPWCKPVTAQCLLEAQSAQSDIEQCRTDSAVSPRIDSLLQSLFRRVHFQAKVGT